MKIAFAGKGGVGKTTLTALLARWIAAEGNPVIALDADRNQHLGLALGLREEELSRLRPLGRDLEGFKTYLRGRNRGLPTADYVLRSTLPGHGSNVFRIDQPDPYLARFEHNVDDVRLLVVGQPARDDVGTAKCFRGAAAAEIFLNHLVDTVDDYALVDMTAGTEALSSGLFAKFDITFLICEPTPRAVHVYRQYKELCEEYRVNLRVVGNKVLDGDDLAFLEREVGDDLLTHFVESSYIKRMDRGRVESLDTLEPANREALARLFNAVHTSEKDWTLFYEQAAALHHKHARSLLRAREGLPKEEKVDDVESIYIGAGAATSL